MEVWGRFDKFHILMSFTFCHKQTIVCLWQKVKTFHKDVGTYTNHKSKKWKLLLKKLVAYNDAYCVSIVIRYVRLEIYRFTLE